MSKKNKTTRTMDTSIPLSNQFEVLSSEEDSESEMETQSVHSQPRGTTKTKTKKQVIPVVADITPLSQQQTTTILKLVKETLPTMKMKYSPGKIVFYTTSEIEHKDIVGSITKLQLKYHTYSRREQVDKKFVIKGLPPLEITDMIQDLKEQGVTPKKLIRMKARDSTQSESATYYMSIPYDTETEKVVAIKDICGILVRWEKYKNPKQVTQCYNCQSYGHGTINCHYESKCVKCAGNHQTKDCTKKPEGKPKCVNCSGEHPANYSKCSTYLKHLEKIELKRLQRTMTPKHLQRPPVNNQQNYPTLPIQRFMGIQAATSQQAEPTQHPAVIGQQQASVIGKNNVRQYNSLLNSSENKINDNLADISELFHEFETLNSLCDIKVLIKSLKALNDKLKNCTDNTQKVLALLEFHQIING